jgi:hypothetical protein
MKKFSKIDESLSSEFLGWSPNDILECLKKIPNCDVKFKYKNYIYREEGHEICTEEDIKSGKIVYSFATFEIEKDSIFHIQYTFNLNFKPSINNNALLFDKGEELRLEENIPLKYIVLVFQSIENNISELRNDFYIHLYQEDKLDMSSLCFDLDFTSKESAEKEYFIK